MSPKCRPRRRETAIQRRRSASIKPPLQSRHRDGPGGFLADGRIEIDNNTVERTVRLIALNFKNALFACHDIVAENWALVALAIETYKLNGVDTHAWLSSMVMAIVKGHKQSQIDDLLPWNHPVTV